MKPCIYKNLCAHMFDRLHCGIAETLVLSRVLFNLIGLVKDDSATLQDIKITSNAKLMVVGSTLKDVETVKTPTPQELQKERQAEGEYYIYLNVDRLCYQIMTFEQCQFVI